MCVVECCLVVVTSCLFCVDWRRLLFAVCCCLLFGIRCRLSLCVVVRRLLVGACCLLFVVRCSLFNVVVA